MWDTYYISYRTANGIKKRKTLTGLSIEDVKTVFNNAVKAEQLDNDFFDCTLIKVWQHKNATPKQKLAQKYGFCIGSIKAAKKIIAIAHTDLIIGAGPKATKTEQGLILVDSQFAKLERDIRDVFKLAGLKVK